MRRWAIAAVVLAAVVAVVPATRHHAVTASSAQGARPGRSGPQWRTDHVLVRLRSGLSPSARRAFGGVPVARTTFRTVAVGAAGVGPTLERLRADARVAVAEPDLLRHLDGAPNDPLYAAHQKAYLSAVRLPQAWDVTHGGTPPNNPIIAVLDSGLRCMEPDFWDGHGECGDSPLPGDHTLQGYDVVHHSPSFFDDDTLHGSAVAAVAASRTNNKVGIAGAGWNARLMPVKVTDYFAGSISDSTVAEGIAWAVDHGARVLNLSFSGLGDSDVLEQAIRYAESKDALIVASAGDDASSRPQYPAASPEPNVLAVSGTDRNGDFAYFSSFGPWVDVAAPGLDITLWARDVVPGYEVWTGTSLSAPLVSGVAALVFAQHPTWTARQVVDDIKATARDRGPKGTDPYYGAGLLDAYAAVLAGHRQGPSLPATDSNNSLAKATPLGTAATGTISPEGDVDWYSVQMKKPGNLAFWVSSPTFDPHRGPNTNLALAVYDSAGTLIRARDRGGLGGSEAVVAPAPTAGRYYVTVADRGGQRSAGSYRITVTTLPFYGFEALDPPAGATDTGPIDIAASGDVLGGYGNGSVDRTAVWHAGAWHDFTAGDPVAINAAGHVLFEHADSRCADSSCPAVDVGAGDPLDAYPLVGGSALNAKDHVAGSWYGPDGTSHAGFWHDGVLVHLTPDTEPAPGSGADDVNDHDQVVGTVTPPTGVSRGFSWLAGKRTTLPNVGGCATVAHRISGTGVIAGEVGRPGRCNPASGDEIYDLAVWRAAKLTVVPPLYGDSDVDVSGVDDAGEVVGEMNSATADLAFVYTHGFAFDLQDLLPPADQAWTAQKARAMDASGRIAVQGVDPDGHYHAFVLTPLAG